DDGPNEPYTSEILKILNENHIRATFFMVGKNVEAFPETVRKVADAGHIIGNHSYDHRDLLKKSNDQVRDEILKTQEAILKVTGQKPYLFRPPYGDRNAFTVQEAQSLGYVVVEWSDSAEDWRKPGVPEIVHRVVKDARNGSIILLHDGDRAHHGSDRSQTV